jgi:predicted CoA-binding protein
MICWLHISKYASKRFIMNITDAKERELLRQAQTIAVVGMSDDPYRSSYSIAEFLQQRGYRIVPVNPYLSGPVLGETPYKQLSDIPIPIDIVAIFRRPEFVPEVVEQALAIGAKAIWMQPGAGNMAAAQRVQAAGVPVLVERCIAVDYRRLQVQRS